MDDVKDPTPAAAAAPDAQKTKPRSDAPEADEAEHESSGLARIDDAVERWFADHFPGSAVARDTLSWNVVHKATEELKRRLAALGI
jgi:hypothetical protein